MSMVSPDYPRLLPDLPPDLPPKEISMVSPDFLRIYREREHGRSLGALEVNRRKTRRCR
jgi:hypothetical protein